MLLRGLAATPWPDATSQLDGSPRLDAASRIGATSRPDATSQPDGCPRHGATCGRLRGARIQCSGLANTRFAYPANLCVSLVNKHSTGDLSPALVGGPLRLLVPGAPSVC